MAHPVYDMAQPFPEGLLKSSCFFLSLPHNACIYQSKNIK